MDDFHIERIDELIHGRVRLGVMAFLAGRGAAEFTQLRDKLAVSDGNLSVHLRKLEDAGYIAIDKAFEARKPITRARLTTAGRDAFVRYLDAMSRLVADPRSPDPTLDRAKGNP